MDSLWKAKSCPIIGTRFRASGGLIHQIFATAAAIRLFQTSEAPF